MGCAPVSFGPGFLARDERRRLGKTFGRHETLQSSQPMLIVMGAVVGFAAVGGGCEFLGQRPGPFFPGEVTLMGKLYGKREGLGLPCFGKRRPIFIPRKAWKGTEAFSL